MRVWCVALVLLIIVAACVFFLFSPSFSVTSIQVSRQDRRVDVEEIQKLLRPYFGNHILFVSPLLLERNVLTEYPEVSSVKVRRNFPNELAVTLYMDPVVARLFIGEPDHTEANFADLVSEGEVIAPGTWYSYLTSKGVYLEYPFPLNAKVEEEVITLHLVDWAVKPTHRQTLLAEDVLNQIRGVRRILQESFGHAIGGITFYLRAQEFHVKTEGLVLWFDLSTPAVKQINRYREFLRTLTAESAEEYVDLRLHDRVVYR
jgi:hypothetical protein